MAKQNENKPAFKYQYLFEEYKITELCPLKGCTPQNRLSYRWIYAPIDHELNFMPNSIFDTKRNKPRRINDKTDLGFICSYCSVSLFDTLENAKKVFKNLPPSAQTNLGYTHVAEGIVTETDGVMDSISSHGHFNFFEYENMKYTERFKKEILSII